MKTTSTTFKITKDMYMEEHFNAVMQYLSFGVSFDPGMRSTKIMNGKLPLVKKTLEFSARHPELIPGYTTLPKYQKDKQMNKDLKMFASDATETLERIAEKKGSVDYIAYAYAMAFVANARRAAEKKGMAAQRVYRELKKEFPVQLRTAA